MVGSPRYTRSLYQGTLFTRGLLYFTSTSKLLLGNLVQRDFHLFFFFLSPLETMNFTPLHKIVKEVREFIFRYFTLKK